MNQNSTNIDLINIISNIITNNDFSSMQLYDPKTKFVINRQKNEKLVEPTKELKGVLTDFIITNFIDLPTQSQIFLKIVYQTFEKAITNYNAAKGYKPDDIFFVYKGGNLLRIVELKALNQLPGVASTVLNDYYKDSFKKSDADFSIYINPKFPEPQFRKIFEDMTNLAFLLLNHLRNIFFLKKKYDYKI